MTTKAQSTEKNDEGTDVSTDETTSTINGRISVAVQLQTPILRKGESISTVHIMRPRTGDLRGLMLAELMHMKADSVAALLPRISVPTLMKQEIDELDPADFVSLGTEVISFLITRQTLESLNA